MTKKYKEACKIIYKSTKEAIETGDKESLFLGDSRKLKSLVGTTCKRVKKTEFSEIYLDNLDILILHRCFLEKVWSAYYKSYGISEELKDVQFEGVSIEKDEMKKHIDRYMELGFIEKVSTGFHWQFVATDRLLRLAKNKVWEWDEVLMDWHQKCMESLEQEGKNIIAERNKTRIQSLRKRYSTWGNCDKHLIDIRDRYAIRNVRRNNDNTLGQSLASHIKETASISRKKRQERSVLASNLEIRRRSLVLSGNNSHHWGVTDV